MSTAYNPQTQIATASSPRWKTVLTYAFLATVAYLLVSEARKIEWQEVGAALQNLQTSSLIKALCATVLSFVIYGCYDMISKAQIRHRASAFQSFCCAVISYGFNLNFGALVGGIAFRYRLYSRFGLEPGVITRIVGFSILSNWLGYVLLLGLLLVFAPISPPESFASLARFKLAAGLLLIGVVAAYLIACGISNKRSFRIFKKEFELPKIPIALVQVATSVSSWVTIGTVLYFLFGGAVPFWTLLLIHLASGLAAVLVQVPAGLGVTEAVYIAFLRNDLSSARILASIFAFRAVYYLIPLATVAIGYLLFETTYKARSTGKK